MTGSARTAQLRRAAGVGALAGLVGPPGHRQGRGVDQRVLEVMGEGVFASDILSFNGLDDRRQSEGVLSQAQDLMADAVGADQAFFSICGR